MASPSLAAEQVILSSCPAVGDDEDNSILTSLMITAEGKFREVPHYNYRDESFRNMTYLVQ